MSKKIAVVLLAAGESSRLGRPKQLLKWGENLLINHVLTEIKKVWYSGYYVVLGAHKESIQSEIEPGFQIIENTNWEKGLGNSIATSVSTLKNDFDAIQFVLVDQPQVDAMYLKFQLHTYQFKEVPVIATQYVDSIGVPAIFDQHYFSELEHIEGNGAKMLLASLPTAQLKVIKPVNYLKDIDTMEQYHSLHRQVFGKEASI